MLRPSLLAALVLAAGASPLRAFTGGAALPFEYELGGLQRRLLDAVRPETAARVPLDKSLLYVGDGDTFFYGKKEEPKLNLRVLGVDAPEVRHYGAGKFEDQEYGPKARDYVRGVVQRAARVDYLPCGKDKYGRTLAHIFVDGRLLAVKLLQRGYAYETISQYGDNGQPELAARILAAARSGPAPAFENPSLWRKRMWSPEKEQAELDKDLAAARTAADKSQITFQDGDTVYFGSLEIRILGIDTPEIAHPEYDKPEGQEYGPEAAEFTRQAISRAGKVEYVLGPGDAYGRVLAHVFVDGELLSLRLLKARLAYETVSRYGSSGFPGYARLILEAFRSVPKPPFQNPQYWRWEHWKQPKPVPPEPDAEAPLF
ncbi:MAG: thermonuclease family protein [Elusimicrobia bacterium]|nr:thermonuclease family protein [Elusimicrobiota bacterium]